MRPWLKVVTFPDDVANSPKARVTIRATIGTGAMVSNLLGSMAPTRCFEVRLIMRSLHGAS